MRASESQANLRQSDNVDDQDQEMEDDDETRESLPSSNGLRIDALRNIVKARLTEIRDRDGEEILMEKNDYVLLLEGMSLPLGQRKERKKRAVQVVPLYQSTLWLWYSQVMPFVRNLWNSSLDLNMNALMLLSRDYVAWCI